MPTPSVNDSRITMNHSFNINAIYIDIIRTTKNDQRLSIQFIELIFPSQLFTINQKTINYFYLSSPRMKKWIKRGVKILLGVIGVILLGGLLAVVLTYISVNEYDVTDPERTKEIFLSSNGVHLDIVLKKEDLPLDLHQGIMAADEAQYIALGWGEENFYLNMPTWADLKFSHGFRALFLSSITLMHCQRYEKHNASWVPVKVSEQELATIVQGVRDSFQLNEGKLIRVADGYGSDDEFYAANGNYTVFRTCNTWVNDQLKSSQAKVLPMDTIRISNCRSV